MPGKILVATGTGNVAPAVVRALADLPDAAVRVGFHDLAKAATVEHLKNVEAAAFDFEDDASALASLEGVDRLCLISPGTKGYYTDEVKRFVGIAAEAGVRHVVRISMVWASDPNVTFGRWHREIEHAIEDSGMTWTILRSQPLMNNFVVYTPPDEQGMIYMPVGNGATAYVSADDLGRAAAAAAAPEGDHVGQTYLVSGPAAITSADVAEAIGQATKRSTQYVDVPDAAARAGMEQYGVPEWLIAGQLECYQSMKQDETAVVTDVVERLTGRPPIGIAQFAQEHADAWAG